MSRKEFIDQLKYLLSDLPQEEREDAIDYYENYFDEAGEDQEQDVIKELESPEKVAAIIRDSVRGEEGSSQYTEEGARNQRYEEKAQVPDKRPLVFGKFHFKGDRNRNLILLALILVGLCTFALPGIAGVSTAALGIFGTVIGLLFGILGGTIGFLVGGIGILVYGIVHIAGNMPEGILFIGGGCISIAIGLLMCMLFLWIVTFLIPRFIKWIVSIFRKEKA